jgi:hypothetical protein
VSDQFSWRDKLAIFDAEVLAVWLIAVALRDRPGSVTDDDIQRLATASQRIQALKVAA